MKKQISIALILALFCGSAMAANPSRQSAISTIMGSTMVLSPLWAPFYGSIQVINDSKYADREKDARKYTVRDKYGNDQTLYVPREIDHKVDIRNGDQVDLEQDDVGVLLKKSGDPKYYFVPQEKGSLLEQTPLN